MTEIISLQLARLIHLHACIISQYITLWVSDFRSNFLYLATDIVFTLICRLFYQLTDESINFNINTRVSHVLVNIHLKFTITWLMHISHRSIFFPDFNYYLYVFCHLMLFKCICNGWLRLIFSLCIDVLNSGRVTFVMFVFSEQGSLFSNFYCVFETFRCFFYFLTFAIQFA